MILRSEQELGDYDRSILHAFFRRAAEHPHQVLAAERQGDDWIELSWWEAAAAAKSLGQALLDLGLGPERPILMLSGNSLAHLKVMLGAFHVGVPVMPVSVAYSLQSNNYERIREIADFTTPGMVFAEDAAQFAPALTRLRDLVPLQCVDRGRGPDLISLGDLMRTEPTSELEEIFASVGPDTVAKILFTSGSTGRPKGVINTHRMLCSNQQALAEIWPFMSSERPVLVDWLPWSHTFGGNHNLNQVIYFGGTLYIDDGRPAPGLFEPTVEALRHTPPSVYYNVPAGFTLLAPRLEEDREFAEVFFSRLRFMFYAAAALPPALWRRLRAVADEVADHPVALTASWGATETAPAATSAHFADAECGCIGVPVPGTTIKLAPAGDKLEIRVLGPNVTPGYFRDPDATAAAFDEEGYYRSGDAVHLVDSDRCSRGLMFDGRLAEDFKLVTGTWVRVGALRNALVSSADILQDAVICGEGRGYIGVLAWLNEAHARAFLGGRDEPSISHPAIRKHLASALALLNQDWGSAKRIERLLLLAEPPDIDSGEITDKGYINQRSVLTRRVDMVEQLFADPIHDNVIAPT